MGMIQCKECTKEMSDKAKVCPHCGYANAFAYCPECGEKISSKASTCPHCGYEVLKTPTVVENSNGQNFGLAIAALICAFVPLVTILSFVFSIIVLNSNKGKQNTAKTLGILSMVFSSIALFFTILWIVIIIIAVANAPYYY